MAAVSIRNRERESGVESDGVAGGSAPSDGDWDDRGGDGEHDEAEPHALSGEPAHVGERRAGGEQREERGLDGDQPAGRGGGHGSHRAAPSECGW